MNTLRQKLLFELLWLALTAVLIAIILSPIYLRIDFQYPFYFTNAGTIIIGMTFVRYIFLLRHHWIAASSWFKLIMVFIPIPVFFFLLNSLYDFQAFLDEENIYSIMENLHFGDQQKLGKYIRAEFVFFWAIAFVANALMPFRMILSVWRKINKGTH